MPIRHEVDVKQYRTWGEFLDAVRVDPTDISQPNRGGYLASRRNESRTEGNYSFYGTNSFKEAVDLAENGWLEGQDQALKLSHPIIEKMVNYIERPDIVYDVEGNSLDVGRFCSDDPECWMKFENEIVEVPSQPRLIRIVFNSAASCGVRKEVMTAKGAAVAALIELLEFAGNRVEVIALPMSLSDNYLAPATTLASVMVKQFDQPLEMARIIFALAHPSMFRRLGFTLAEKSSHQAQQEWGSCYGFPGEYSPEVLTEYGLKPDLYFSSSSWGEQQWTSETEVKKWIFKTLTEQGVKIKEEALNA